MRLLSLDMDEEVDLFDAAREAWRGPAGRSRDVKRVVGGFLVQDRDLAEVDVTKCEVATIARALGRRSAGARFRLARLQARQVERDRGDEPATR